MRFTARLRNGGRDRLVGVGAVHGVPHGPRGRAVHHRGCALCPDATLQIDAVAKTHDFAWHIDNAFSSTLAEELEVHALPAILVFHSIDKHKVYEKLRGDDVTRILHAECPPRLVLDGDF